MKTILIFTLMLLMLSSPRKVFDASLHALCTWGIDVVPSMFPYMVLCQSLASQLSRSRLLSLLSIPTLGLLGGSPAGSAALAKIIESRSLSKRSLLTLGTLTGTISPMFFLGPVSSWMKSEEAGKMLFFSQLSGAVVSSLLVFMLFPASKTCVKIELHSYHTMRNPIQRSIDSVLNVGGCIIFYSAAASCISILLPWLNESVRAALHAFIEVSGGIKAIAECSVSLTTKLLLCSAAAGFSGISILSQNLVFLRSFGITFKELFYAGLLRAHLSAATMLLLLSISAVL